MNSSKTSQTTWAEDEGIEAAVLRQLLELHPTRLTPAELQRQLGGDREGFAGRDAISRAVRELTAAGLLHEGGEFVVPTRAALRCSELLER